MDRTLMPYLRYAHGIYNMLVILLFLYQGRLGAKIRRERKQDRQPSFDIVRRHRRLGPILSIIGFFGFISGLILVFIDVGILFVFRPHFIFGTVISIFIAIIYSSSWMIKSRESAWRTPHFIAGIILTCLYVVQLYLGLKILF
jgi:hypothetical protein